MPCLLTLLCVPLGPFRSASDCQSDCCATQKSCVRLAWGQLGARRLESATACASELAQKLRNIIIVIIIIISSFRSDRLQISMAFLAHTVTFLIKLFSDLGSYQNCSRWNHMPVYASRGCVFENLDSGWLHAQPDDARSKKIQDFRHFV
jgi:hypothetical protein